jgi:lipoprotein-anchoring transpeptidase ErfK/SrfK
VSTPTPIKTAVIPSTSTSTAIPTLTPTVTPTPEPVWYQPLDPSIGILKYNYAQVINRRARIYVSLPDAVAKTGNFGYPPNYPAYVAYTSTETRDGYTYYQVSVTYGWMDGEDLQLLTPSTFTGILLTRQVSFRFGWVLADTQSVNAAGVPLKTYFRYQVIHEVPAATDLPDHIAIGTDEWLPVDKVALVSTQLPAEAGPNTCRFIYTDLKTQTLSVYDGCKLVFATLISSGKNDWTFEGRFTILYKVEYSTIIPPPESTSDYYIEGVPYFMTYLGNFGFHGAYWHDDFGAATSHGCINLSPTDAKWLYDWAQLGDVALISAGK